jgi:hypothetical protein
MPLLFILARVLGLLGVVTREQLDEFVFVDPYLVDPPARQIEHDVEDFQLVVLQDAHPICCSGQDDRSRIHRRIVGYQVCRDVECVGVLLDGFAEPCRGVVQVAVQCGRAERITHRFLVVLASSLIYLTG